MPNLNKHPKKNHTHGPHLSDATSNEQILAGSQEWAKHIVTSDNPNGEFTFTLSAEHAIDEDTDLLLVVRKRVKK